MKAREAAWSVLFLVFLASLVSTPASSFDVQAPTLADVLARAAERASELAEPGRVITCEERHSQRLSKIRAIIGYDMTGPVGARTDVTRDGVNNREWVAELVLVATPGNDEVGFPWMEFRDIVEIDAKPVRDGVSRLKLLQVNPSIAADQAAVRISAEAGNYILGRLVRAADVPRHAALFLHPSNQPRFEFKKGGERTIDGVRAWEIKFREKKKPTVIRASGDKDAPSTGSLWVDPATGNVLMSVLKSPDATTIYDEQTVTYAVDPESGLSLPATLEEKIVDDDAGQRVEATATFSKWRVVPRGPK